jgi:hypothetical protein
MHGAKSRIRACRFEKRVSGQLVLVDFRRSDDNLEGSLATPSGQMSTAPGEPGGAGRFGCVPAQHHALDWHFGSATSRTRTHDVTREHDPCEPPPGAGSPPHASTRRSRQGGAPHRTNDLDGDKRRRTLQRADPGPLTTEGRRCDAGPSVSWLGASHKSPTSGSRPEPGADGAARPCCDQRGARET